MTLQIPKFIYLGFDPESSRDKKIKEIFSNRTSKLLWCVIRWNHVTDQYFNDQIINASKELQDFNEKNVAYAFNLFFKMICNSKLNQFGKIFIEERWPLFSYAKPDPEYWKQIYNILIGKQQLGIVVEKEMKDKLMQLIKKEIEIYKKDGEHPKMNFRKSVLSQMKRNKLSPATKQYLKKLGNIENEKGTIAFGEWIIQYVNRIDK